LAQIFLWGLKKTVEILEGVVNFCIIGERNTTSALVLAVIFYGDINTHISSYAQCQDDRRTNNKPTEKTILGLK